MRNVSKALLRKVLPFKDPFLLIDKILLYEPEKKIIAQKHLTGKEWFLRGHFPGNPVMPGHLIAESMVQTCSLLFGKFSYEKIKDKKFYLYSSKTRFFNIVKPGNILTVTAYPVKMFSWAGVVRAEVRIKNKLIAKGEFTIALK